MGVWGVFSVRRILKLLERRVGRRDSRGVVGESRRREREREEGEKKREWKERGRGNERERKEDCFLAAKIADRNSTQPP